MAVRFDIDDCLGAWAYFCGEEIASRNSAYYIKWFTDIGLYSPGKDFTNYKTFKGRWFHFLRLRNPAYVKKFFLQESVGFEDWYWRTYLYG